MTTSQQLRNVYTAEQFATEILCGNLSVWWVRNEVKKKRLKAVSRHPVLIPQSEAARFINPTAK